ncbi:hypothetical protein CBP35_13460 [Acidovorax carolinensis]|uniref:sialidase family protein n=1 Tax=Acidovorax carolinensis TaxID=553814 RepID=UPI000B615F64|nr:sialidase family protein [Acidovorax carolinensis]ART55746.1 hypothetical protein CBP35_13460 [Acidovorax carolinensis]
MDGSLVSRALYPDAKSVVGDVRFFDGTPLVADTAMAPPAGATTSAGSSKTVAIGSTFIVAPIISYTASGTTMRLWRSTDAGANWSTVDVNAGAGTQVSAVALEWFGAGRLLMVVRAWNSSTGSFSHAIVFSNDLGATWSAPQIVGNGYDLSSITVTADAQMLASGTGYYYVGATMSSTPGQGVLYALNPLTNTVKTYNMGPDGASFGNCIVLGGRVTGAGTSEILLARYVSSVLTPLKLTFDGAAFTTGVAGVAYSASYFPPVAGGRSYLTRGGDGNDYLAMATGAVYRMPASWSGTPVQIHTGLTDAGTRLISNTLSNPLTGLGFDLATGAETRLSGANAGASKIGAQYGLAAKDWTIAPATDKVPSANRHFMQIASQAGSFAVRSTRCASNFMGGFAGTADAGRFMTYSAGPDIRWYDPDTGVCKTVQMVNTAGSNYSLRVSSYAPAQDYANYVHMPYLPGLVCRIK